MAQNAKNENRQWHLNLWNIMELAKRITVDPKICHGKPTIRGLRYPVENILELLGSGMSFEEILADYEDLEMEDIVAVLIEYRGSYC